MTDSRNSRKVRTGVVTSVSGAKTIVVTITERKRHPKYGKMMTSSKKLAVTWAYSPSYGKPLSCPQSLISLLPRFGMDVTLAHPEGYDLMPEVVERAK